MIISCILHHKILSRFKHDLSEIRDENDRALARILKLPISFERVPTQNGLKLYTKTDLPTSTLLAYLVRQTIPNTPIRFLC